MFTSPLRTAILDKIFWQTWKILFTCVPPHRHMPTSYKILGTLVLPPVYKISFLVIYFVQIIFDGTYSVKQICLRFEQRPVRVELRCKLQEKLHRVTVL